MKEEFKRKFSLAVLLVVLGSLTTAGYFYREYQRVKNDPDSIFKEEVESVTKSIEKFMELPDGEEPTLATITDIDKLKDQDFFKNAQNGDKVLIYTQAGKAILYRPSINKVIEFAPLVIGPQDGVNSQSQQTEPSTVAIYNGTPVGGLTNDYEEKLTQITGLSVTEKTNAAKNDYTQTYVIDISGENGALVQKINQLVEGEILNSIPEGETQPQADILIIVGK